MLINTGTSKLSLIIEGADKSEVILLLHGGPGVPDYLGEVAGILSDRFKTVRFDQRGVGNSRSKNEEYEIVQYLSDIDSILDHLRVDQVHIFGHSWGGLLAQLWAANNQEKVKSLFLCSPSSGAGKVWETMEKEVMNYNKEKTTSMEWASMGLNSLLGIIGLNYGYRNVFKQVWKNYFLIPSEAPDASKAWLAGINAKAVNKTRKSVVANDNNILNHKLNGFNAPVTVTFGKYDIYGESKNLVQERFLNSTQTVFDNAGHLPWIQDKESFSLVVNKFYGVANKNG